MGKSGLHHSHLPLLLEKPWRARLAASLFRLLIPVLLCPQTSAGRHNPALKLRDGEVTLWRVILVSGLHCSRYRAKVSPIAASAGKLTG
jgi:hypothetical protein